ncbi:amino acid ABC transporter permease [Acuticoccus sp. I52.16.1]|uniref:amino acid ABC transporter permease n=1 Tax=Acuticoccus sp. I52.16.1 TaxID=2928472 RepID=UPI001FD373A3|nr:amino acid ABC transporter permease [Acuticoccus sp. I52.16.1]UOM33113.1 amino acid ABC transporter permease [Acuticoccus sp. I52.16.1]
MNTQDWQTAIPFLLEGLGVTLYVSLAGTALGCVIGLAVAAMRGGPVLPLSLLARVYVSFFRGVPLLVQMLLFYNFLPFVGIDLSAPASAIGALGLVGGAYIAEILRGARAAIPGGQVEAARAFGYAPVTIWRTILLPQMVRIAMPAITSEFILLVKASSLISVVGLAELTRVAQGFAASTFRPMEFYLAAAALYLVTNLLVAAGGRAIERKFSRGAA